MMNKELRLIRIGRDQNMDVCLLDSTVSRRHAELVLLPSGKCYLSDCGSTSGTCFFSGEGWQSISQAHLTLDDTVSLGDHEATIRELAEEAGGHMSSDWNIAHEATEDHLDRADRIRRDPETGDLIAD